MKLLNLLLIFGLFVFSACKIAPVSEPIIDEICDTFTPFHETADINTLVLEIKCPCETEPIDLSTNLIPYTNVQSMIYKCDSESFEQIPTMPSVTRLSSKIMTSNITAFPNLEVFTNNELMETPLAYQLISMPKLNELSLFNVTQFPDVLGTRPLEIFKMTYENSASYNVTVPANLYQLENLKDLSLKNMMVTDFTNWGNLSSLENLKVSNTPIIRFPNIVDQWKKMKTFELSEVTMRGGTPNFFQYADSLESVYLGEMEVSDGLQENICQAPNLKSLSFSFCEINSISADIGNLISLEELIITSEQNNLNNPILLPTTIHNLIHLKSIFISINMTSFPTALFGLQNTLESLAIQDDIGLIPSEIGNFTALKTLKLTNCGLTSLPSEIQNLSNTLEKLYLNGNDFNAAAKSQIQNWLPNTDVYF